MKKTLLSVATIALLVTGVQAQTEKEARLERSHSAQCSAFYVAVVDTKITIDAVDALLAQLRDRELSKVLEGLSEELLDTVSIVAEGYEKCLSGKDVKKFSYINSKVNVLTTKLERILNEY